MTLGQQLLLAIRQHDGVLLDSTEEAEIFFTAGPVYDAKKPGQVPQFTDHDKSIRTILSPQSYQT